MSITEIRDGWAILFDQGGIILWLILVLSVFMWVLIFERLWFFKAELNALRRKLAADWQKLDVHAKSNPKAVVYLSQLLSERFENETRQHLTSIQTITAILPMLGLLGTVSGMISVFDVITVFGSGNTRGMASGISHALVTTMAGLLTALSGLYFSTHLENKSTEETLKFLKSLDIE